MRFSIFLLVFVFTCVRCKNHVKALTESLGQEVIEIGAPVKDLPPGLDEEPSAEFEEEEKTTGASPLTKRETRKTTTVQTTTVQKAASARRSDDGLSAEEEEKRIEKELSEIYKDTDYKAESSKSLSTLGTVENTAALRQRGRANFKFQPDVNDRADVERFRTSVDDISCDKRVTQRLSDAAVNNNNNNGSSRLLRSTIAMCLAFISTLACQ